MYKTKEQRRRDIKKIQRDKINALLKAKQKEIKERENFPGFIKTLNNRLKRMDPWVGVATMNSWNCALITFFKLKQYGINNLRIATTSNRAWVEFNYNDEWWIFDPTTIKNKELGSPIKRQRFIGVPIKKEDKIGDLWKIRNKISAPNNKGKLYIKHPEYNELKRYFTDIEIYLEVFIDRLNYDFDEAQIAAMKDKGLNLIFRSHL